MKTHASHLSKISNHSAYGLAAVLTLGAAWSHGCSKTLYPRRHTRAYGTGRPSTGCCPAALPQLLPLHLASGDMTAMTPAAPVAAAPAPPPPPKQYTVAAGTPGCAHRADNQCEEQQCGRYVRRDPGSVRRGSRSECYPCGCTGYGDSRGGQKGRGDSRARAIWA